MTVASDAAREFASDTVRESALGFAHRAVCAASRAGGKIAVDVLSAS